jgi:cob(I)alamin adenosyltransferase
LADSEEKKASIYTGTRDRGKTSLFSGERVSKSLERVEAYGDVDERFPGSLVYTEIFY